MKKCLTILMIIALAMSFTKPALANTVSEQAQNLMAPPVAAENINILDRTTPAAAFQNRPGDRNTWIFTAVDGRELGWISHSDYNAIISRNSEQVALPGGGWQRVPRAGLGVPVDQWGIPNWPVWFVGEFNRLRGIGVATGEAARAELAANQAAAQAERIEQYRRELVRLVNKARERHGLKPLEAHHDLMDASQIRAGELVVSFSHTRPDGSHHDVGAGEVAHHGSSNPGGAFGAWMNSPRHRAIIMNPNRVLIGTGVHATENGSFFWQMYIAFEIF